MIRPSIPFAEYKYATKISAHRKGLVTTPFIVYCFQSRTDSFEENAVWTKESMQWYQTGNTLYTTYILPPTVQSSCLLVLDLTVFGDVNIIGDYKGPPEITVMYLDTEWRTAEPQISLQADGGDSLERDGSFGTDFFQAVYRIPYLSRLKFEFAWAIFDTARTAIHTLLLSATLYHDRPWTSS